ncbi:MAG: dTMP kinase [Gammaproteobacteria bacterium]|nr:dTMP kinase [Gammaproteobacteria bacterium]
MNNGRFIVLEGGEGAGKTTQLGAIAAWLRARGREVLVTREPGGSRLAEAIRDLVLGHWEEGVDSKTELLLIFAARAAHIQATIRPALQRGVDVVCDRFIDSSHAYQGGGRGVPMPAIDWLSEFVVGTALPDLVLLLDLPPETGAARTGRRTGNNRFDTENLTFQQRVRTAYLQRRAAAPQRYVLIDASQPAASVTAAIDAALRTHLGERGDGR